MEVERYETVSQRYPIPSFIMKGDGVQAREKNAEMESVGDVMEGRLRA